MAVQIPDMIREWNPRVVPIQVGRKGPTTPKWTETQVRASDVKFGAEHDKYGIVLDADTLVIDVDVHDPAKNGYAALERLSKDCGTDLLDVAAFVVESPSGGRHLYFSKASELKLPKSVQEYQGLDFLSAGCQVIGPGSTHVDGGEYAIETSPEDVPVNEAPLPKIDHLLAPRAPEPPAEAPVRASGCSPLDDFNKSPEALQYVKIALEQKGYRVIVKGDGTYEFIRPGKRTSTHAISGTLGRSVSKGGNLLLKNFSTSDGILPAEAITLSEAFRLLEGHGRESLPALLRQCGFGDDGWSGDLPEIEFALGTATSGADISQSYPQLTIDELSEECPERRPYVIEGLLRQGETLNIVAAPKTGKSWFVYNLAITLANGGDFLGWTSPNNLNCLIVDNELHKNELAWRLKTVEDALGVKAGKSLRVSALRGSGLDIKGLEAMLEEVNASQYDVIVLDALYRFLPEGTSENDNAQMMLLYNALDRIGRVYDVSIIVVHHASKGNQSEKSITDIGAGAGSISRAADSQLILVPHEVQPLVCVEAVTRSSKSPEAFSAYLEDGKWFRSDLEPQRKQKTGSVRQQCSEKKDNAEERRMHYFKKLLPWLEKREKDGLKLVYHKEQREEVFGGDCNDKMIAKYLSMASQVGICGKPLYGNYKFTDDWKENLNQWIFDGCPKPKEPTQ